MRIYHVSTLADWQRAKIVGTYTTSTYGASLEDVGFIHAARAEQVTGVVAERYADVDEPILLLEIETGLLDVPWREDPVDGDTFPHIYGPLDIRAVVGFHYAYATPKETATRLRPPADPLVSGFFGLAAVSLSVALALLVAAAIASVHAGDSLRPTAAPTVLWALTLASLAATLMSCIVALVLDRRRPAP
jgi:glutathione S-transferase